MNKTELLMDKDLRAVVEFMQGNVESQKLFGIADALPKIARLLWADAAQEPIKPMMLRASFGLSQPTASGCDLAGKCVGDGSAVEVCVPQRL